MKRLAQLLALGILVFLPMLIEAQQTSLDYMRSTGKIYVVIAVVVVIFLGIFFFLIRLDKKLTKLENQINNGH